MTLWAVQLLVCSGVILLFLGSRALSARLGNPPWASPVLVAAAGVGGRLWLTGVPVREFEVAAAPLRLALLPAIVALGAVIHRGRRAIAAQPRALLVAVTGGTVVGVASAIGLSHALGLEPLLVAGLTTKTLTTPFAVAVATRVGGPVSLAAALAVLTGVIGALLVPPLLRAARVRGVAATGIAIGQSAHLVGTDMLTRRDAGAATWSAVTMVLSGVFAALVLPWLWPWLT